MALPPQPDTADLRRRGRQRLIGAIAIVLLAVVFIPMALDPAPRTESRAPALAIPARDAVAPLPPPTAPVKSLAPSMAAAKPAQPVVAPVATPDTAAPATTVPASTAPASTAPAAAMKVREPDAAAAKKGAPASASATVPAASIPPAAATVPAAAAPPARLEGFAVQVGAFRDDVKLTQAREKLTAAKITHFIERLPTGDLTRLRAGPYPTRPAAEKALAGVKAAGLEGQVVPLP